MRRSMVAVLAVLGAVLGATGLWELVRQVVGVTSATPWLILAGALLGMVGGTVLVAVTEHSRRHRTALRTLGFSAMGAGVLLLVSMVG